jgi:DNA-binding GntR family transcriptional regulator
MVALHRRLLEAVRTRDVESARQALLDEMRATQRITMEHAIQQEGNTWQLKKTAR